MAETEILPQEISDIEIAFPAHSLRLMPPMEEIPDEFKGQHTKWNRFVSDWFFLGVKDLKLTPREGIDSEKAMRQLRAIMGSYEPKHEHKEAATAYLLSLWYEDVKWKSAKHG